MPQLPTIDSDDDQTPHPTGGLGALIALIPSPLSACLPSSSASSSQHDAAPPGSTSSAGGGGWTSLFGGSRGGTRPTNPSSAGGSRAADERRSLLHSDDYDDSDAISLLSNIVERDARGSSASRCRAKARRRAARENNGMGWSNVGQLMACGLFGRAKGQIQSREIMPSSAASNIRHARSLSESSAESDGSLTAAARMGGGDEDAGMLDDQAIRNLSLVSSPGEPSDYGEQAAEAANHQAQAKQEQEAEAAERVKVDAEEQAEAERKQKREEEAARLKRETDEEEAAIAKARRKAERKAAKAGLLKLQQETKAAQRWKTEAEAEAAAGGFDFADEGQGEAQHGRQGYGYGQEEHYGHQQYFDDGIPQQQQVYGDFDEAEDEEAFYYPGEGQQQQQPTGEYVVEEHQQGSGGGVVHHHHYYHHAPPPASTAGGAHVFLSPTLSHGMSTGFPPQIITDQFDDAEEEGRGGREATPGVESEDEADIAGASFGKRKTKRNDSESGCRSGGVAGSSSQHSGGSGSAGGMYHRSSYANPVAAAAAASSSSSSSSAAGVSKPSYRDRPRRHERQGSRSSNSSPGLHYAGGGEGSFRPASGASPGGSASGAASYAVPTLPNLYEQESTLAMEGHASLYAPLDHGDAALAAAAAKKKRSYRDKRSGNGETASAGSNHSSNVKVTSPVFATAAAGNRGGFNSPRNPTEFGRWQDRESRAGAGGGFEGVPSL